MKLYGPTVGVTDAVDVVLDDVEVTMLKIVADDDVDDDDEVEETVLD